MPAAFVSWDLSPGLLALTLVTAVIYWRGWRRLQHSAPHRFTTNRLICFCLGLLGLYVAIASPLDAFANFLLSVHMVQHLLLTMVVPPLLLLGSPFLPMLLGLPRRFAVDGIGPFLAWKPLKRLGRLLVHPVFALGAFMISNITWHIPTLYEIALRNEFWHRVEHLCFLGTAILFWWPVVQPWPSRPVWPRWAMIPYMLLADLQNTALAAFISFYNRVLYPTYTEAPRIADISARADQSAAGAIMWVPGSMAFLVPAGILAIRLLSPQRHFAALQPVRKPIAARAKSAPRLPWLPYLRRPLQWLLLLLAGIVVWDGFAGPPVSAMNAAGVLPWTHWRGLTVLALLFVGNLFCMSCPFMLVRDGARKITSWLRLPAQPLNWPRLLRNKWLPVVLLAAYLWTYEAYSLWDWPAATSVIILGYFVAATAIDLVFKKASFCKYICPIGQFHFVQSLASPGEIRIREPDVCRTCRTYDCIKGNTEQRGCELLLFQPRKSGNMDCTFCFDCVKACPHDNVSLQATVPGADLWNTGPRSSIGRWENRPDLAALVLLLTFGAFANAAGMIAPVQNFAASLSLSHVAFTTIFLLVFLVLSPAIFTLTAAAISRASEKSTASLVSFASAYAVAFAPLGFGMWLAHFVFHFFTASHTPIPVIQRLLGQTPQWNVASWAWPGLVGVEMLLLDAGFLLTAYATWRIARNRTTQPFSAALPWLVVATILYVVGVWIIFQPMQMRGTMAG